MRLRLLGVLRFTALLLVGVPAMADELVALTDAVEGEVRIAGDEAAAGQITLFFLDIPPIPPGPRCLLDPTGPGIVG